MKAFGPIMWGKIPVPYTAVWTGEQPLGAKIEWVPQLGAHFLHEDRQLPGVGKPLLSTLHCGRCIEVVVKNICQLCRRSLDARSAYCINYGEMFQGKPHIVDGLPMCATCVKTAFQFCPTLKKHAAEKEKVWIYHAHGIGLAPPIMGAVDPAAGGRPEVNAALAEFRKSDQRTPVFGTPKLVLTRYLKMTPQEFGAV